MGGGMSEQKEACPCKRRLFLLKVGVFLDKGVCS